MGRRCWFAAACAVALAAPVFVWAPTCAADEPKKPTAKPDPTADVFGPDKVWQLHFEMTAAEYQAMQPAAVVFGFGGPPMGAPPKKEPPKPGARETHRSVFGTEFPLAEAALTADGQALPKVGLRYKGNSTYLATSRALKRSLKVDLDRFDEGARFRGLKSLNLHCGVMDPTRVREALAYSIYRAAGVPAPRTAFAEVALTVPGKYDREHVGLYTLTEGVDKGFLKRHYGTADGLLMKPERMTRGLEYHGDTWGRYKDTYQPKRDATADEQKRVIAFAKLVERGTDAEFEKEIAGYLDVDAFLTFMAATAILSNLDSFFVIGHNYCLYLHPKTNRFHFVPWDVDLALGNFAFLGTPEQQMDLSLTKPYVQSRLADRLMANKATAAKYLATVKRLVPLCFDKPKLLAEVAALEKTVKPLIEKEQKVVAARKETGFGFGPPAFGRPAPDLRTFVERRSESIAAQLEGKRAGYSPTAVGFGGPPPAPPKPGDVLPPGVQTTLSMTDAQKRELADLQKRVDAELEKILTPEQRSQLKRLRDGAGGFGPPKGP